MNTFCTWQKYFLIICFIFEFSQRYHNITYICFFHNITILITYSAYLHNQKNKFGKQIADPIRILILCKPVCNATFQFNFESKPFSNPASLGVQWQTHEPKNYMYINMYVYFSGEMSVSYLFTRYRFNWNEVDFSMFSTYAMCTSLVGTFIVFI